MERTGMKRTEKDQQLDVKKPEDKGYVRELVQKSKAGDKQAYRELVERYQTRAFRIAYDILQSQEDAEDVVQESFVKAYLSLKHFQEKSAFYTWFYRIVYNMSIDHKRKRSRRGGVALEFDESYLNTEGADSSYLYEPVQTPDDMLKRKEQAQDISKVLNTISDEHRTVMMLREIDGLSYDRIAEVVGVSKGTVMSRLHYARKKLQEGLKDLKMAS